MGRPSAALPASAISINFAKRHVTVPGTSLPPIPVGQDEMTLEDFNSLIRRVRAAAPLFGVAKAGA